MTSKTLKILVWGFGFFLICDKIFAKTLDFNKVKHYQISIEEKVYGLHRFGDRVWSVPRRGNFFISSHYNPDGKDYRDAFLMGDRSTALSERIELPGNQKNKGTWRGPIHLSNHILFIDADNLRMFGYNLEKKSFSLSGDLIIDRLMPPPDSRGRATRTEVKEVRARLLREFNGYKNVYSIIAGLSQFDESGKQGGRFLISTRLPSFPLAVSACEQGRKIFCSIKTTCYVSEAKATKVNPMDRAGLAYSRKRGYVLIGSKKHRKIYVYRYKSCFDVGYVKSIAVPKQVREISSLHVDEDDALWVASSEPDPYTFGSVFKWASQDW